MTFQFSLQPIAKLCNDFSIFFAAPGQAAGWCWAGGCEGACWVPGKLLNSIIIIIIINSTINLIILLLATKIQDQPCLNSIHVEYCAFRGVPLTLEDTTDLSATRSPRLWDRPSGATICLNFKLSIFPVRFNTIIDTLVLDSSLWTWKSYQDWKRAFKWHTLSCACSFRISNTWYCHFESRLLWYK